VACYKLNFESLRGSKSFIYIYIYIYIKHGSIFEVIYAIVQGKYGTRRSLHVF